MAPSWSQSMELFFFLLFSVLCLIDCCDGIQLFSVLSAVPSSVPAACASALTGNITCQQFIPASYVAAQRSLNEATLAGLCTTTCSDSLLQFQSHVDAACGTEAYTFPGNISQTVQQFVDPLVWAYNVSCLTNASSFCLPEITNSSTPISPCSECALLYGAAMLSSPYGMARIDPGSFSSILSSCDVPASSYPYTTPSSTSATATSTASNTIATCTGTLYTVQKNDTCNSISLANNIATDRFLTENNLDYNCSNLVVGNEVCLGASCALHQVQANDTCDSILDTETFYLTQLLSWNPTIHATCDNLGSMVGRDICISPPGSTSWDVVPENITTSWNVTFLIPSTSFTSIPVQTSVPTYNTTWYVPTSTFNISTTTFSINITQVTVIASLTVDCPISYNDTEGGWTVPDLEDYCNQTAALTQYCLPSSNATMPPSTSFPMTCSPSYWDDLAAATTSIPSTTSSAPPPEQTGISPNCDAFYVVQANDTCQGIVDVFGNFTLAEFYSWNPAVGSSCSFLDPTYAVCIGVTGLSSSSTIRTSSTSTVPSPLEPSTDPSCTSYYLVVDNDSCSGIEEKFGITAAEFNAWNPHVGTDCLYLDLGDYVCVGAPYTSSSTTPTSTTTTSATQTYPTPLQPSSLTDCSAYHLVVANDYCSLIEQEYGITTDQFNAWNPGVGTACLYLDLNDYVCVGPPSPLATDTISTCTTFHLVVTNDYCALIEEEYGITADQFNEWNPSVGTDCLHLDLGEYVCVGDSS